MPQSPLTAYRRKTAKAVIEPHTVLSALQYTNMRVPVKAWSRIEQKHLKEICFHAGVPAEYVNNPHGSMDVNAHLARATSEEAVRARIYKLFTKLENDKGKR